MNTDESAAAPISTALGEIDARGLIADAFAMEDIVEADCRSIFFDWALGLADEIDQTAAIEALIAHFEPTAPEHPMVAVLLEGVGRRPGAPSRAAADGRRKGGRRRRVDDG